MARKGQVAIQDNIDTDEEFEQYLVEHAHQLICIEVYCEFCGNCMAASNALRRGKLEIGQDRVAMGKALADNIKALKRFQDKSEPVFLFIVKGKLSRVMFGSNGIELCNIIEEELAYFNREMETGISRPRAPIDEMLPEESEKIAEELKLEEEYREASERLRVLTLAARKRRVCERLAKHVTHLNFIIFWPHCHHAHKALYEKWDTYNISVGAKEMVKMDENAIKEAFYMSDVDPNEACLYALMDGEVMTVLFKMLDSDTRDFVKLLRYALYEEIPVPKEDVPPEEQPPLVTAYERFGSISKPARVIRRERYNAKMEKLRIEREENERLEAERARLQREADAEKQKEAELAKQAQAELAEAEGEEGEQGVEGGEGGEGGEGEEGEQKEEEAQTVEPDEEVVEPEAEEVEQEEEFHSDVEVEGEDYIPPEGLFVPGLYAPPNELAKANGLAFFFPKFVSTIAPIESEVLPPHVLVIFTIEKRHEVQEVMKNYADDILAMGVFAGDDPFSAEHVAYTIKQYDTLERIRRHKDRLALMVSRKKSVALLQLAGLNPCYISSDVTAGEKDCLQLFPVGYGDEYEEEPSIEEEEIVEVPPEPEHEVEPAPAEGEEAAKNEDDDDDDA